MTAVEWHLAPVELDAVWQHLELGDPPYPLEVRSHGATEGERRQLHHRAIAELRVEPAEPLRLLCQTQYWVNSVWVDEERLTRLLAGAAGGRAVLAVQLPAGDLIIREISAFSLADEVVAALPPAPAGCQRGGTLPASAFAGKPSRPEDGFLVSLAEQDGGQARTRRSLGQLLDTPHLRSGQFTANRRDRVGRRHQSTTVFWFDKAGDGRYCAVLRARRNSEPWVTVTPAYPGHLWSRLGEVLDEVDGRQ